MKCLRKTVIFNSNVQIKKKKSMINIIINKAVFNVIEPIEKIKAPEQTQKKIEDSDVIVDKENKGRRSPSPQRCIYLNLTFIARKGGFGFSVLSPTNQFNDMYGFNSPLNLCASQFYNKNNNFSICLETNYYNQNNVNNQFNPLSIISPYNINKNVFSN